MSEYVPCFLTFVAEINLYLFSKFLNIIIPVSLLFIVSIQYYSLLQKPNAYLQARRTLQAKITLQSPI